MFFLGIKLKTCIFQGYPAHEKKIMGISPFEFKDKNTCGLADDVTIPHVNLGEPSLMVTKPGRCERFGLCMVLRGVRDM